MQKHKIHKKFTRNKRTTHRKHSKSYLRVYAPYLPAIVLLFISLSVFIINSSPGLASRVLSYATNTTTTGLLVETNNERSKVAVKNLRINTSLNQAAQAKADDMAKRDYWSHNTPEGQEPWIFLDKFNYEYIKASENLAYGFVSSANTVNGWMNSTLHRQAMLDKNVVEVGFGIANSPSYQDKGEQTIIVAFYGRPASLASGVQLNQQPTEVATASPTQKINFAQTNIGSGVSWLNFAFGFGLGLAVTFIVLKHTVLLRRKVIQGENYILHHPQVDLTVLSIILLVIALSSTAGFIR